MSAKNMQLINGPVKGVENFAINNNVTGDLKITTFGQTTNLNSTNAVNRQVKRNGHWYCIEYLTYNRGFEKSSVVNAFANKMSNEHGWNIYNNACYQITGGNGHYALDQNHSSDDVNKNFGGEFGLLEVQTWKWHSS